MRWALVVVVLVGCVRTEITECGFGLCPRGTVCDEVHKLCSLCGNGITEAGEECEDANTTSNDGCSESCTVETPAWEAWSPSIPWRKRSSHAAAYDAPNDILVVATGFTDRNEFGETWQRRGSSTWTRMMDSPPVFDAAMAYDEARSRVVLFGGNLPPGVSDVTYQYKDDAWSIVPSTLQPDARYAPVMVYDEAREKLVLFGGTGPSGFLNDTWTLDGNGWANVTKPPPSPSPSPRANAAAAWDPNRAMVVVFGGADHDSLFGDTWGFDGTDWIELTPTTSPPARRNAAMAFLPRQPLSNDALVLFGGRGIDPQQLNDTWELDGTDWSQRALPTSPPGVQDHTLTRVGIGRLTLVGGGNGDQPLSDNVWEYTGTWTRNDPIFSPPNISGGAILDGPQDEVVVLDNTTPFGVWRFTGTDWRELRPEAGISERQQYMMAFDTKRMRLVVFGGAGSAIFGDTWEWDGFSWHEVMVAGPPMRYGGTMEFHEADGVAVLIGGRTSPSTPTFLSDTWSFNGSAWTKVSDTSGVGPITLPSMTYDRAREKIVLHGGQSPGGILRNDTWEYDDGVWTQVATSGDPPASYFSRITYHTLRNHVILRSEMSPGLWELVDGVWNPVSVAGESPMVMGPMVMQREAIVMIGKAQTWFLRWGL